MIWAEPLQEKQEEEVNNSNKGENRACHSTTVRAQSMQSCRQWQNGLPAHPIIHLKQTQKEWANFTMMVITFQNKILNITNLKIWFSIFFFFLINNLFSKETLH